MYKRAVHYLQGSEWVEIQCACPERVLNLLGARGIVFWDLTWESEICLRLRMLLRQEALLREIADLEATLGSEKKVKSLICKELEQVAQNCQGWGDFCKGWV